jgi:hypothetical protein
MGDISGPQRLSLAHGLRIREILGRERPGRRILNIDNRLAFELFHLRVSGKKRNNEKANG